MLKRKEKVGKQYKSQDVKCQLKRSSSSFL